MGSQLNNETPYQYIYVGGSGDKYVYAHSSDANTFSYVAHLVPNETYTIQRCDETARFRLGTMTENPLNFLGTSSSLDKDLIRWFILDNSEPFTFTMQENENYLIIYYTYENEKNTRVMLNIGNKIMPYEKITYDGLDILLNTIDDMEVLINNTKKDDNTITVQGVDWFQFNGVTAANLYASGNHWIGIGANSEHLQVCRRDGAMWYLYRQEGTLYGFYKFLKLRWEGHTQYNNTTDSTALKFELFLFDTGDMFLNVVQFPTSSSYWGTSALTCGGTTTPLTLDGTSMAVSFYHLDDTGSTWDIKYEQLQITLPFNRRFLLRAPDGILYTETDGSLTALSETNLSAQLFLDSGMLKLPESALLLSVPDLTVLCWQDGGYIPDMSSEIAAVPYNQTIFTDNQDMTHPTITGIESVVADADENTLFAISFDDGITWKAHNGTAWNVLTEEQSGMTKATLENIGIDAWAEVATTGKYRIRFTLPEGGWVKQIKMNYLNRERADI